MTYIIPDNAYRVLKWVAMIVIPAVATFVGTVGTACGWDPTGLVVTIITAVGTLIGSVIGVSSKTAKPETSTEAE